MLAFSPLQAIFITVSSNSDETEVFMSNFAIAWEMYNVFISVHVHQSLIQSDSCASFGIVMLLYQIVLLIFQNIKFVRFCSSCFSNIHWFAEILSLFLVGLYLSCSFTPRVSINTGTKFSAVPTCGYCNQVLLV